MKKLALLNLGIALSVICIGPVRAQDSNAKPEKELPPIKYDPSPLPAGTPSFAPIVDKVAPSIVTISTSKVVHGNAAGGPPNLSQNLRRFFNIPIPDDEDQTPAPSRKKNKNDKGHNQPLGLGSGVIVSPDGYILTNNHVVEGADDIAVTMGDNTHQYPAKKIGADPESDIAVIKIEGKDLPAITFSDSTKIRAGDIVVAVGNPFGLTRSATMGIVSAVDRTSVSIITPGMESVIQTDAAINLGNSGGALVDYLGRLVGINSAIYSRTGGNEGIGFAIPSNMARSVMETLLKSGKVQRGFLGIEMQPLSEDLAQQLKVPADTTGVAVADVLKESPAAKAGVKVGDVVVSVDNKKVASTHELSFTIGSFNPGAKVELKLLRQGEEKTVAVNLGERTPNGGVDQAVPQEPSEDVPDVLDGVTVGDVDSTVRDELHLPEDTNGVIVKDLDPDSPSAAAGIQKGDVILEINRQPVSSAKQAVDLSEKLKKEKSILLRVKSPHGPTRFVNVSRK
ncbi:MAG TPA: Do family serine endopeptidase [Chthoniobacteraceae bacterium]|jgi:serine protease Do